ncbi:MULTISPECIES: hypothetical protein [Streptomyces]
MTISERRNPASYQAALVCGALSSSRGHADADQAAAGAGLRPLALAALRETVREALRCPVDFRDVTGSPDAVIGGNDSGRPCSTPSANAAPWSCSTHAAARS